MRTTVPVVQVVCVTYNQEAYIRDALEGFVMQKTTFPFEVLVADDCSTDGTSAIVAEYAEKYPERITHLRREQNMGCLPNFIDVCERITAPYAAFCDGDDYWTDENKLQKQYAYMERNSDVNLCAHRTRIDATPEWTLYEFFKRRKFLVPTEYPVGKRLRLHNIVSEWPHTSSFLIRWKQGIIPEWAKDRGREGAALILCIQTGTGGVFVMPQVMSVYRRGAGGVFDCTGSFADHMLRTRLEMMKLMENLIGYFRLNYNSYCVPTFSGRLWREIIHYLNAAVKTDQWNKLQELKDALPDSYAKAKDLLSEYSFRLKALNVLGHSSADMLFRGNRFLWSLRFVIPFAVWTRDFGKWIRKIVRNAVAIVRYWMGALVPKNPRLWVVSCFKASTYLDNAKYFFEYTAKNHPEIKIVFMTRSKNVEKSLRALRLPVCDMCTFRGRWLMRRAAIAIIDHFRMTDLGWWGGFNARTKIVNLWHGMGLKNMAPEGDRIPNTGTPGVQLSSDILPMEGNGVFLRLRKKVRYVFRAPIREMFEKYFMIVCPSQAFIDNWAAPLRLPQESWFMCGYPRNVNFFKNEVPSHAGVRIIYAPTYRMGASMERRMVDTFLRAVPELDEFLERRSAEFVLRLHPHTWRDYSADIRRTLANRPRFSISSEPDIYKELHEYSVMVADYSSITQDFLVGGRPVVYFAFDREEFLKSDCGLNMSYEENCAGPVTTTWTEAIAGIEAALDNPEEYAEKRRTVCEKFFPSRYNDVDNSERIVNEIKRRLGI